MGTPDRDEGGGRARAFLLLCSFVQAAELDRAEEFKHATEGLALCRARMSQYGVSTFRRHATPVQY
jgi:hypothetical protein